MTYLYISNIVYVEKLSHDMVFIFLLVVYIPFASSSLHSGMVHPLHTPTYNPYGFH